MVSAPVPSPDGAADESGAAPGEVEVARPVLVPPDALAASPRPWRARLHLGRLRRALRRDGWTVEQRYTESPLMLRVYSADMPCLGDSVSVVREADGWWFWSSTGDLLAPCGRVDLAASAVAASLRPPWLGLAMRVRSPGGM
jgi:hypothetical protein